jgi:hypothetical protein
VSSGRQRSRRSSGVRLRKGMRVGILPATFFSRLFKWGILRIDSARGEQRRLDGGERTRQQRNLNIRHSGREAG